MIQDALNANNIFAIEAGSYLKNTRGDEYILYAPLAARAVLTDKEHINKYEYWLSSCSGLENKAAFAIDTTIKKMLTYVPLNERPNRIKRPEDIFKISVIPTHSCNLSCAYCYSSRDRSDKPLAKNKLKAALDFFIDPGRLEKRYLHLSVIGGGEPLLQWGLVKETIEYADALAQKGQFEVDKILITNGTIMDDAIIAFLKKHDVVPNISFDILPQNHNAQRGDYKGIVRTIERLLDSGIAPTLNATITPATAPLQPEMAKFVTERFPEIKNLIFEPVIDKNYFATEETFSDFHSHFTNGFFEARRIGIKHGIEIRCKAFINMFNLTAYGCEFRFSLTPEGAITNCYCVSSPKEPNFDNRVIGKIDDRGSVILDYPKFNRMLESDVNSKAKCTDCFIKWNCGGGCLLARENYHEAYLDILCQHTKDFSIRTIIEKYNLDKNQVNNLSA